MQKMREEAKELEMKESVNKVMDSILTNVENILTKEKMDKMDQFDFSQMRSKIVDLSDYGMPPCIILRSDGASLYATRDLAAAYYRKKTYDFYKSLYVVAYQQNLHFRQIFKVLEKLGKDWAEDCVHVAFGMVSMESGAMSTRKGKVIYLEDVLNKAVEKSYEIITEKSPDLADKKATAEMVGVGAVIFSVLYNSRIKDIVFSYDNKLKSRGIHIFFCIFVFYCRFNHKINVSRHF